MVGMKPGLWSCFCWPRRNPKTPRRKKPRKAFLSLSDTEREILVRNVWVFDRTADIVDVREEIEELLHYSAQANQLQAFTDELEGWWFSRVIGALGGRRPFGDPGGVRGEEGFGTAGAV